MSDVTRILSAIDQADPRAAERLLPLVYGELRQLAASKLAREAPGQTLQATALVHEAYLRLLDGGQPQDWSGRGHFFAGLTFAEAARVFGVSASTADNDWAYARSWLRLEIEGRGVDGD